MPSGSPMYFYEVNASKKYTNITPTDLASITRCGGMQALLSESHEANTDKNPRPPQRTSSTFHITLRSQNRQDFTIFQHCSNTCWACMSTNVYDTTAKSGTTRCYTEVLLVVFPGSQDTAKSKQYLENTCLLITSLVLRSRFGD